MRVTGLTQVPTRHWLGGAREELGPRESGCVRRRRRSVGGRGGWMDWDFDSWEWAGGSLRCGKRGHDGSSRRQQQKLGWRAGWRCKGHANQSTQLRSGEPTVMRRHARHQRGRLSRWMFQKGGIPGRFDRTNSQPKTGRAQTLRRQAIK